jgi:hypothetical protein
MAAMMASSSSLPHARPAAHTHTPASLTTVFVRLIRVIGVAPPAPRVAYTDPIHGFFDLLLVQAAAVVFVQLL